MKSTALLITLCFLVTTTITQAQTEFDVLNTNTESAIIATSFINDNEGWLADTINLWHTKDGGASFELVSSGKYFVKLAFIDAMNGFALGEKEAYKTNDSGATWQAIALESIGSSVYFLNKNTGFISGNNVIFKTINNGENWTTISIASLWFNDYYFTNDDVGFAAAFDLNGYKSLWRTTDGGQNWENVFENINYYINSVWFTNENTGWAVGYYDVNGVTHEPVILQSTDAGFTWKKIYHNSEVTGQGQELLDIRFKNETEGFAISNLFDNVFTSDGGLTWTRTYDSETFGLPVYGGIYSTLSGLNQMYISGSEGYLVKWK